MDRPPWSLQDAKNRFSAVVKAALEGSPQTVTKRGKPAVVVVSVAQYERLCRREIGEARSFIDHLLAIPQDGGSFERARVRPREVDL